jgi:acyl carrier protein
MNAIRTLIADTLRMPPESVTGETAMMNTEAWDSLKHMELILGVEQSFDLMLDGDEIAQMTSVSAIEEVLRAKGMET